ATTIRPEASAGPEIPGASPRVNRRWSGYRQLLVARTRELYREPEVIFWVFVFPILLALGLGIAFRNKPAEVSRVVVVAGPRAARALEMLKSSPAGSSVQAEVLPEAEAFDEFRLGKYDLVATPEPDGSFEYRYDPARTE